MRQNVGKKVWGVLGKQKTYYSELKQLEGKEKTPLNKNPLEPWDYKKSRYRRIDLVPKDSQQGGVVAQSTPSPTPPPVAVTWDNNSTLWNNESRLWNTI